MAGQLLENIIHCICSELLLQTGRCVKSLDLPVHHNGNPVTIFSLIHIMRSYKYSNSPVGCLIDQFWELIYQAADQGITIFVTTHYMDEAEFCGRVSIMVDGKIRALDTPEGLKRTFGEKDMDGVFHRLAREATRNAEIYG